MLLSCNYVRWINFCNNQWHHDDLVWKLWREDPKLCSCLYTFCKAGMFHQNLSGWECFWLWRLVCLLDIPLMKTVIISVFYQDNDKIGVWLKQILYTKSTQGPDMCTLLDTVIHMHIFRSRGGSWACDCFSTLFNISS